MNSDSYERPMPPLSSEEKSLFGERFFLERLFARLNQENVRYAVMRNYEPLPFSAGGSDLDLLVAPEDAEKARALLFSTITMSGGVPIGVAESVSFFKVYILGQTPHDPGDWWGLRIDMNLGVYYKGSPMLADRGIDYSEQHHNGIAVLSKGLAGVLGVLKEVLNNDKFPAHYLPAARLAVQTEWPRISSLLAPMGEAALREFRDLLAFDTAPDNLPQRCAAIRSRMHRYALSKRPLGYLLGRVRFGWCRLRRYLKAPGMVIAILGVDGAGKSTVIDAILPALQAATHNAVWVQHLRPGLLPPLARLKGQKNVSTGPVLEPHGSEPSGSLGSIVRLVYLTLDYWLGYWIRVRPKIAKQPTVVLFDRYAYDMALDPRRFRIGLPASVAGLFAKLAPKPDLILCLQGDPKIIAARKRELPIEETRRQVEALRAFASEESRAVLIATDMRVSETRDQVLGAILNFLSQKHDQRYV